MKQFCVVIDNLCFILSTINNFESVEQVNKCTNVLMFMPFMFYNPANDKIEQRRIASVFMSKIIHNRYSEIRISDFYKNQTW